MNAEALTVHFTHMTLLPHFLQTESHWLLKLDSLRSMKCQKMTKKITSQVPIVMSYNVFSHLANNLGFSLTQTEKPRKCSHLES